ncbi:MAG TPA: hypothetical protein VES67_09265 [Vicinamibacterales bacterium]|nr:hypothetical protein [Vicinamibacterales bacterium]
MAALKLRRGRPRKFGRPARPITLTLPDDVISRLAAVDGDLGRAIVSLVDAAPVPSRARRAAASISSFGRHAVILVPPVAALRRLRGIQLVPVGNGRALIALDHPHAIPQLELDLRDALDRTGLTTGDRGVLETVAEILRDARQSNVLTIAERSIIVLEGRRKN